MKKLSLRLAVILTSVAVAGVSANATVIQYDDGSWEEGWQIGWPFKVGVLFNNPLTPPSHLTSISLDVAVTGTDPTKNQLQIYVVDPNNSFNNIVSPFTINLAANSGIDWETIDVSSLNISVNSAFLIGVHWDVSGSGSNVFLGYDKDSGNNSQSYDYNCGKWGGSCWGSPPDPTGQGDFGLWMIRADVEPTPLPAALPLFASGLGALGLLGWRRKKKAAALAS